MTDRNFYARVFADAADRVGGHEQLAKALDVDIEALFAWVSGRARPPTEVVLRIADMK